MDKNEGMSLNPEDFTEGGGLVDDVNVIWNKVRFEMFDYQGSVPGGAPALKIDMKDEDGEEHEQYYSMGSANDWSPSMDGKQLISVGSASGIRASSNGGILLKSLVDSGFPKDQIGDDITVFEGLQCHVIRVPAPKRPGIKKKEREDGRDFGPDTILIVDEIIAMPGEKKKPKGAPGKDKAKAKGKTKEEAPAASEGLITKAQEAVLELVLEHGEVTKKKLPTLVFASMKDDTDRNAIAKLVFQDDFLEGGEWEYDGDSGILSMG